MSKHTPGNFYREGLRIMDTQFCSGKQITFRGRAGGEQADADLLAAAPELLEALEAGHLSAWVHNAAHTQDIEALRRICLEYAKWWNDIALPVIEKARGE